jgi:hypothetical protein
MTCGQLARGGREIHVQLRKENKMSKTEHLKDLSSRLSAIADDVMAASELEKDELSAHLWILRSVTIRDYAESVASLQERAARP